MAGIMTYLAREKFFLPGDREGMVSHTDRKLRKLLRHTLKHSAFYREYYRQNGIGPENVEEVSLTDLPFVNKDMLMEHFDGAVCRKDLKLGEIEDYLSSGPDYRQWYRGRYKIIKTSGNSGKPGVFVYGKNDWNSLLALLIHRVSYLNLNPFRKVRQAVIVDTHGLHAGNSLLSSAPKLLYETLMIDIHERVDSITEKLNRFQPEILSGYAFGVFSAACEQLKGNLKISPWQVGCSGEILLPEMREKIMEAFHVEPTNMYASSESICIAASGADNRMDIFHDMNLLECLDDEDREVPEGAVGNVVLTNLYNYTLPLIRYRMNDRLAVRQAPHHDHSRPYPWIETIEGRREEVLYFTDARGNTEPIFYSFISIFYHQDIKVYQIVQEERNLLTIRVVFRDPAREEELKRHLYGKLARVFESKGLHDCVKIHIAGVDSIDIDPQTGKFRHIVPFQESGADRMFRN